ncbi:copper amine oxidase N-terminal domain-containing protein [Paenibacillus sp. NPDC056579]|uniref:copper amine oxidase N-terminal domain-containing protein n=1 Tax=Paenibacillus sp. NPDC056579 TaxID=3345871 RepID=UPI0036AF7993
MGWLFKKYRYLMSVSFILLSLLSSNAVLAADDSTDQLKAQIKERLEQRAKEIEDQLTELEERERVLEEEAKNREERLRYLEEKKRELEENARKKVEQQMEEQKLEESKLNEQLNTSEYQLTLEKLRNFKPIEQQVEYASANVKVYYGENTVVFDQEPVIVNNSTTVVPLRVIVELFGTAVIWDDNGKIIVLEKDGKIVVMQIGNKTTYVNNIAGNLETEPLLINGVTMIPVRFIAEAFDTKVQWVDETRTIHITPIK